ncbi:hypothetical protein ABPG74_010835 [Tetrahymena malaccensis]
MRFSAILLLGILIGTAIAVTMKTKLNSPQAKAIENLRNAKHSWSKLVLNLAELHMMMTDSSFDELEQVLNDLIQDLSDKSQRYQNNFNEETSAHNEAVSRFNSEISSANSDIASTTSLLNDVLYPKKHDLEITIASQEQDIDDSQSYIDKITSDRDESHNKWVQRVDDHNSAVTAIDDAEKILNQLLYGDPVSMIQVQASKNALIKIEKQLSKQIDSSLAKALVDLATKEYANQETVRKVLDMLEQIKSSIQSSLISENSNENREQSDFEKNLEITNEHIYNVSNSLATNKNDLDNTNNTIQQNEAFLALRKQDLTSATSDLETEQQHFQQVTNNFNDIIDQINTELDSCHQALTIVENGTFASFIQEKFHSIQ